MIDMSFAAASRTRYAYVNWFSVTAVPEPAGAMILLPVMLLSTRRIRKCMARL